MNKKTDLIYVWGFVAVLFTLSLLFLLQPKQTFSEVENRPLQQPPSFSWDNLWSKQLTKDIEEYVTDHFPFRQQWVGLKSTLEQLRLQQENNGIFKGKDGYLLEQFDQPDAEKLTGYLAAIEAFTMKHPNADMTFMLVQIN